MGRKTEINQQTIDQICNKIKAEGNIPTVDRVRLEAGTGSRTTINRMIRNYEKQNKSDFTVKKTTEMNHLFDRFIQETGKAYMAQISEIKRQLDECHEKNEHYLLESERYLEELEAEQEKCQKLQEDNSWLKIQLENKENEISKLSCKIDELSNIHQLFKMLQTENEILKQLNQEKKDESLTLRKQFENLMNLISKKEIQINKELDIPKKIKT